MKHEQMGDELGHGCQVIDRIAPARAKLIEDLLEVSRINSGKLRIAPRLMAMDGVIDAALDSVRPGAQAKGIVLEYDPAPLPLLQGDPDRLSPSQSTRMTCWPP